MTERIEGIVAKLVTDDELLINRGLIHGVEKGMEFAVLDPSTMDVKDPETGENLGSIVRTKARVVVTTVGERLALTRISTSRGISAVASAMAGRTGVLTGDAWPEGVRVKDPVIQVRPARGVRSEDRAS